MAFSPPSPLPPVNMIGVESHGISLPPLPAKYLSFEPISSPFMEPTPSQTSTVLPTDQNTSRASPPSPLSLVENIAAPPPYSVSPPQGPSDNKTLVLGLGIGAAVLIIVVVILVLRYRRSWAGFALAMAVSTHLPPHHLQGPTSKGDDEVEVVVVPTPPRYAASNPLLSSKRSSTPQSPLSMHERSGSEKLLPQSEAKMDFNFSVNRFTYEQLSLATEDFSDANLLGRGGFGYVHKGVLMDGKEVAIKQLKLDSRQGEREFRAEVEIISRVHHKYLVSLVGYCAAGDQRMLVYEFVPNNTLDFQLHGKGQIPINWATRMKVALGSAKGLAYLHEDCQPKIIHRDIKATNILLDINFEPKVADFGLAHFYLDTDTHVSTRIIGTFGYIAPEYAQFGQLTEKSDVFSFGVMLLELITGRRPTDKVQFSDDIFVERARPLLSQAVKDGNFDTLADPRLQKNYDSTEMARMVACASSCMRRSAKRRPRMSQIVRALEGNIPLEDLNDNTKPGSVNYGTKEERKTFQEIVFESQDNNSSGYSGPTSGPTSDSGHQLSFSTSSTSEGLRTIPYLG